MKARNCLFGPARILAVLIASLFGVSFAHGQKAKSARPQKGYGTASYNVSSNGTFMRTWLVAGPVELGSDHADAKQEEFFKNDKAVSVSVDPKVVAPALNVAGKTFSWSHHASNDDLVDFDNLFKKDFASAYAMAEIRSETGGKMFLALGSDDGVRVWLNGKLVHDNWIPRGVTPDEDLVPVDLVKGSNQILIKVQDIAGGWGFTARILNNELLNDRLIGSALRGNLDEVNLLLTAGASHSAKNKSGLSPVTAAKIGGREDIVRLLIAKGATDESVPPLETLVASEYSMLQGKKAAGIAVLVAIDGKVISKKAFGYANIEKNELIDVDTKFRIGSITKQFIGAAILKLQEESKLSVTDKLSKYVADFPRGEEVTIHHLLTHTSGIHSFTDRPDFISRVTSPITEEELINNIKADPYDFSPGEQFRYNNSGYFLLGHIIRKVTGETYGEYLKEKFFAPLGMTNTGVYETSLKLQKEAIGYTKENGAYKPALDWNMTWAGGAGALYSTTEDLFAWSEALFNGKVLSPESMKALFAPVRLNNGEYPPQGKYGYGWFISEYRGLEAIGHGGGLSGFSTRLQRFTKDNVTIVMLTNLTPTEVNLEPNSIAQFVLWEKMEKQSSYSAREVKEDVRVYEGRYDFGNGMVMKVTSEQNQLFAQLTGQPRFPIFPSAPGEYFWKVVEAKVKFVKDDNGNVIYGDFVQGGARLKVQKLKEEQLFSIDPSLLDNYTGKYDYGNNFHITVIREENRLYAQGTNQPRIEIFPVSETEFTAKDINARVTFIKEGNIKATKLILDMGGQKREAPRIE
jgi:CubicO group peptidase (beta-lactamase class C family)